jgi:rod shape-determining protein MreD
MAVFQIGFVNGLPAFFCAVNLLAVVLVFLVGLSGLRVALGWAVGMGFVLDIYSYLFFGAHILALTAITYLVHFLMANFLTNRSLYVFLVLTVVALAINGLVLFVIGYAESLIGFSPTDWELGGDFWQHQLNSLIVNSVVVVILFYILNLISNTFKPVFLRGLSREGRR